MKNLLCLLGLHTWRECECRRCGALHDVNVTTDYDEAWYDAGMDRFMATGKFVHSCETCGGRRTKPFEDMPVKINELSPAEMARIKRLAASNPRSDPPRTRAAGKTQDLPKEIAADLGGGVKLRMVLIPAGEFLMGSPDSDKYAEDDEKPQHRVRIAQPFYLGEHVVTQEQWEAVMGGNPSNFKGPNNPVENVSWDDCQKFLDKLNRRPGNQAGVFQLPTEAQWEYACRAGSTTNYCFGDEESGLGEYAWYGANSGSKTHPVGEKKPNAWGLYDMHGNVWEWCADWHDGGYYARSPIDDPTGPTGSSDRVFRGGGWNRPAGLCRSASRRSRWPGRRYFTLGLRISQVLADA